jgi:rhodanese-related sulfurtransferase
VWITADDCAHYWPESRRIHLKLVYERSSLRVVGVQGVGEGEVVKRIDAATQLIARGATVAELAQMEHAYAPPYAPAVDPLALLAWTAQNQEDGVEAASPTVALGEVIDVRLPEEREARPADAAAIEELSVIDLRDGQSVRTAPPGLIVCERGARSAEAARLLQDRGGARYLGGGLQWRVAAATGATGEEPAATGTGDPVTRVRD